MRRIFEGKKRPYVSYSVWKFLYSKEAIASMTFHTGRLYENIIYTTEALWGESKVAVCESQLYFYRVRDDSIMKNVITEKGIKDVFVYCDELLDFYEKNAIEEKVYIKEAILWTILQYRYESLVADDFNACTYFDRYLNLRKLSFSNIKGKSITKVLSYFMWTGTKSSCMLYCLLYVLSHR